MRFSATSLLTTLVLAATCVHSLPQDAEAAGRPSKPRTVCDPNASGHRLEKRQQEAAEDFAQLYIVEKDVQTAFDIYSPGEYIQHSPYAEQGREFAINFLNQAFAMGTTITQHTVFSGQGRGLMHYKMHAPLFNMTWAAADYFRFQGTCIVEHWDVMQVITGDETNPIAYF